MRNLPPITDPACAPIADLLRDPKVPKGAHHLKYDWQVLRRAGIEIQGAAYDSMLASFCLDSGRRSHAIDVLSLEHLGVPMRSYEDLTGKGKSQIPFAEVPVADAAAYCGHDSATVLALHAFFAPKLTEIGGDKVLRDQEMPLVPVLVDMEWEGVAIDGPLFARLGNDLGRDLQALEAKIAAEAGASVNLNSPKQLGVLLFEKLQLPVLKKTKTGASTDAEVLEQLAEMGHEVPKLILEYREVQKLKSTYVDLLPSEIHPVTHRIHTSFHQTGAATGRLSSSHPHLQNIPRRTPRRCPRRVRGPPSARPPRRPPRQPYRRCPRAPPPAQRVRLRRPPALRPSSRSPSSPPAARRSGRSTRPSDRPSTDPCR